MRTLELTEVADTLAGRLATPAEPHDAPVVRTRWRVARLHAHGVELEQVGVGEQRASGRGTPGDGADGDVAAGRLGGSEPPAWVYVGTGPVLAPGCGRAEPTSLAGLAPGEQVTLDADAAVLAAPVDTRLAAVGSPASGHAALPDEVLDSLTEAAGGSWLHSGPGAARLERVVTALARAEQETSPFQTPPTPAHLAPGGTQGEAPVPASAELDEALGGLVGLGPGLTPSGDDALVALIARHLARTGEVPAWTRGILARLDADPQATTQASAQYLRHAATGHVSVPLARVVTDLATALPGTTEPTEPTDLTDIADIADLEAHTRALVHVGATSGADALAALLAAERATARATTTPDSAR